MRLPDRKLFVYLLSLCVLAVLPSCDDDDDDDDDGGGQGAVTVSVTDAASDQIVRAFVQIESIRLHRLDGQIADILTTPVEIDLAALHDTAQILRIAVIPSGNYDSIEAVVDLSGSEFVITGQPGPATVTDAGGTPFAGPMTLNIDLANPMQVSGGDNRSLVLEFPIDESVLVDTTANSVRVEPVFVAQVNPQNPKPLIGFGRLVSASTATNDIVVTLESIDGVALTDATFEGDGETVYHIAGVAHGATSGLAALETISTGTFVEILGEVDADAPEIDATFVSAGVGTLNDGRDFVDGWVVDRTGGAGADAVLTVLGNSEDATHTVQQWNTSFTVNTSFTNTAVLKPLSSQLFDMDDVNVGQRLRVFGALSGTTMDATGTNTAVKLLRARAFGTAQGPSVANVLTIALTKVDSLPETAFLWPSGGTTPPDPANFEIAVGSLDNGLGIGTGTQVESAGFFLPVDDDTEDFTADTLKNVDSADVLMLIKDLPAVGQQVTATMVPGTITFTITGGIVTGEIAVIDRGLAGATTLPAVPSPSVVPAGDFRGMLYDRQTGTVDQFNDFGNYSDRLATALSSGAQLASVSANGPYDDVVNEVRAHRMIVVLQ